MTIRIGELAAMRDAGWAVIGEAAGGVTMRWETEHRTPARWREPYVTTLGTIPAAYPYPTYLRSTCLTFTLKSGVVRGQVLLADAVAPWLPGTQRWVSQREALEIAREAQQRVSDGVPPRCSG